MFDKKMPPQKVQIPGFPYYITIDGEVYRNGAKKPLKPILRRDGYSVNLSNKGKKRSVRVNNLMRELYFNGIKLPLKHLNGCKTDFSYWNLKPMQRSKIPLFERKNGWNAKCVIETLPDGTDHLYASAAECARAIHVSCSAVRKWCNGKHKNTSNENEYRWG